MKKTVIGVRYNIMFWKQQMFYAILTNTRVLKRNVNTSYLCLKSLSILWKTCARPSWFFLCIHPIMLWCHWLLYEIEWCHPKKKWCHQKWGYDVIKLCCDVIGCYVKLIDVIQRKCNVIRSEVVMSSKCVLVSRK